MTRLRAATAADLPLLRRWMQDAPEAPAWGVDDLAAAVGTGGTTGARARRAWVAEVEGLGAAGFVTVAALCVAGSAPECELEFVLVMPEARGRGLGAQLVDRAAEWVRGLGGDELRLEVRASNEAAQRLYASRGFVENGRRRGYYAHPAEDAVLMRLAFKK